jgi:hypothetical protein
MKIINFYTVDWSPVGVKSDKVASGIEGAATCLIINNKIVRIINVDLDFHNILTEAIEFKEGQGKENIFVVEIIREGKEKIIFICDEMLQAILLSDPIIVKIEEYHKYKELVTTGWSYIDGEFIIPGEME